MFDHIASYAGDPVFGLTDALQKDPRSHKINLGIGLYHDEDGRIPLLPVVAKAEAALALEVHARPYLPMEGIAAYREAVQDMVFGASHEAVTSGRIATIQTVGGSGALKVGADFLKRYFPDSEVWLSDPTWGSHHAIFEGAGFKVRTYPYYDPVTASVRFDDMLAALKSMPEQTVILLQPCCHNPTGADLSNNQWEEILSVVLDRKLISFLDMAYQGFGDGLDEDAFVIRAMAQTGARFLVSNSFSKNLSFYSERCGSLSVVCADKSEAARVLGQLKCTVGTNYSSPPNHGGQIVARVLLDPLLREEWEAEVTAMRVRIKTMRQKLFYALSSRLAGWDLQYLLKQRGMFSYTGLSADQVDRLRDEFGIYLVRSGRICVAGINSRNVEYVAEAIAKVIVD
ncbi:amino acid aminotransferase [Glaciimonas sp. CA11.2]|uniref:amino acid aminotransferase n=1 Tax=unclassified Glaciimonas TaxID=2644401 RepID=UPI002AB3CD95|nr:MULTISPECIES: amino acid aminotransferase [unclassified Glaciimonas]MDY7545105.1 amino acid aminotransferase [Glaciimonas sp. CA11.2]MEB0011427.1 amino acid aminotransferase [Glaciimonas sp. Cout2]MEB0081078.1 amino acid aminotransferase [Glaciimonas sp. Gout2]MEB0163786.1 amino acid aminotransferase [Glaciimonas sp. CA11.2]